MITSRESQDIGVAILIRVMIFAFLSGFAVCAVMVAAFMLIQYLSTPRVDRTIFAKEYVVPARQPINDKESK